MISIHQILKNSNITFEGNEKNTIFQNHMYPHWSPLKKKQEAHKDLAHNGLLMEQA